MADAMKHASINGGSMISELRTLFSLFRTRRTVAFAYGFMFAFIAFTVFLAFSPSSNSSSPWFTSIFSSSSRASAHSTTSSSPIFSEESDGSQFSSIFSYFFPNSSHPVRNFAPPQSPNTTARSPNATLHSPISNKEPVPAKNQTQNKDLHGRADVFRPNQGTIDAAKSRLAANLTANSVPPKSSSTVKGAPGNEHNSISQTANPVTKSPSEVKVPTGNEQKTVNQIANSAPKSSSSVKNPTGNEEKRVAAKGGNSNSGASVFQKQLNRTNAGVSVQQKSESADLVKSLMSCNLFDGEWVRDESYPLYKPGSCSLIDEQFNCFRNGRPDNVYHKLKWKPKGCSLPRLNGSHMLEILRGKRLVFVGDSLNRNMWESLVCILRNSAKDKSKVYEAYGRQHFRAEASYSFVFKDYNFTVEFFASPFLVREWEVPGKNGSKKETLRLDLIGETADQYKGADIIIFNTGHWWTHEKTSKGEDYYQEGSHVYSELNVLEAFRKALTTWGRWVDTNINPRRTLVLFRGYSASHFSGGQWNSGGQCDHETEPIKNEMYLSEYPPKMMVLEKVFRGMKTPVSYLNITRMSDYRKDGHPSIYRKQNLSDEERRSPLQFQDCSHWCLPGVPDAWNELLYAEILIKQNQKQQQQNRP